MLPSTLLLPEQMSQLEAMFGGTKNMALETSQTLLITIVKVKREGTDLF